MNRTGIATILIVVGVFSLLSGLWQWLIPGYLLDPKDASDTPDNWGTVLIFGGLLLIVIGGIRLRKREGK